MSALRTADRLTQLTELREQTERILDSVIPPRGDIAYIEFSISPNVGNHMMWLATMRYLHSRGRRIGYVAHNLNYRPEDLRQAIGGGPILITGGVGAAGIWPAIRAVRHSVIQDNPSNPIVLLPQTVHFRTAEERKESQAVLGLHSNLTLLPRDADSLVEACASFPRALVELTPDLAFLLPPQRRRRPARNSVVWMARDDIETSGVTPPAGVHRFDWAFPEASEWRGAYLLLRASGIASRLRKRVRARGPRRVANAALVRAYETISQLTLDYGNHTADRGEIFVTDRMHGHLLAVLRGQTTVLLPDAYGKNRSIYDTWSSRFDCVHWASTAEEAINLDVFRAVREAA